MYYKYQNKSSENLFDNFVHNFDKLTVDLKHYDCYDYDDDDVVDYYC